jgi:hypothetical protein
MHARGRRSRLQNTRFAIPPRRIVKDRRKEIRPATRLQVLSLAGGLAASSASDLERALTSLYVTQPVRWQAYMDEVQLLIEAVTDNHSGFAETVAPGDG